MNKWITSDLHHWHKNIIKFSPKREHFDSVEQMNEFLIEEWNNKVKPDDIIYHLGDFCFAGKTKVTDILDRLNGQKVFILGNHDYKLKSLYQEYGQVEHYMEIKHNDVKVCLMHYPILAWNQQGRGSVMLHGHCHGMLKPDHSKGRILDVGWCNHGKILSLDEAVQECLNKDIVSVDGHSVV